jgi:hypothetical protein
MNSSFDQDGKEQPDEGVTTAQGTTGSMMEAKMAAGTIGDKFLPSLFKSEARYDDKLLDYGFENIKLKYMVRADKMENSNQRTHVLSRNSSKSSVYKLS